MDKSLFLYVTAALSALATNARSAEQLTLTSFSAEDRNKKRQRHSGPGRRVAVSQLAFQQMIYFCADGLKIIQAEIYNGIADVRNLVHFL